MTVEEAIADAVRQAVRGELAQLEARLASLVRPTESASADGLMTVESAATFAAVNPATVRQWLKKGLRSYRDGRVVRVSRQDLLAYLSEDAARATDIDKQANEIMKSL